MQRRDFLRAIAGAAAVAAVPLPEATSKVFVAEARSQWADISSDPIVWQFMGGKPQAAWDVFDKEGTDAHAQTA